MAVGLTLGLISNAFIAVVSERHAQIYLGVLLAGIGFVYLGFAIADGRTSAIAVQIASAAVFLNLASLGVQHESSLLLGAGFVAHGAWD